MIDLVNTTLAAFAPHLGTPFVLAHAEQQETFILVQADRVSPHGAPSGVREPFSLIFDGGRTDVQFEQQTLPLTHAALGALALFLVPIARNPDGTVRYQAVFN